MKRKAEQYYPFLDKKQAHKLADHLKACSCALCGNRRRYEGPTFQELRRPDVAEALEDLTDA